MPPHLPPGALLGGYETLRFKSKKSPTASRLETLHVLLPGAVPEQMATKARAVASGAMLTRCRLDDQGGGVPEQMATKARAVASGAMLTRWGLLQCVRGAEPFLFPDLSLSSVPLQVSCRGPPQCVHAYAPGRGGSPHRSALPFDHDTQGGCRERSV